jgi:hypothetical protein
MAEVKVLKAQLRQTGFLTQAEYQDDNTLSPVFTRAICEFQRYASMAWAAQRNLPVRPAVPIPEAFTSFQLQARHRYAGPITGQYQDAATQNALAAWAADHLFCPVIMQVLLRKGRKLAPLPTTDELNFWEQLPGSTGTAASQRVVAAWDFSRHFVADQVMLGPVLIGKAAKLVVGKGHGALSDFPPTTNPCRTGYEMRWPGAGAVPGLDTEVLPETWLGKSFDSLSPGEKSLFRMARALSEVECYGYFDSLNAYDKAVMSVGICHWALAPDGKTSEGELAGLLSCFAKQAPAEEVRKLLNTFGIEAEKAWDADPNSPDGGALLNSSLGTYATKLKTAYEGPVAEFRNWHWAYRFVMALRTLPGLRQAIWHLTALRISNILQKEFKSSAGVGKVTMGTQERLARYGDVFRSEQAVALLLRWHVNKPAVVMDVSAGSAASWISKILAQAVKPALRATDPTNWAADVQQTLAQALLNGRAPGLPGGFKETLQRVATWPHYKGRDPGYLPKQPFAQPLQAHGTLVFPAPAAPSAPTAALPVAPKTHGKIPAAATAVGILSTDKLVVRGFDLNDQEVFQVVSRLPATGKPQLVMLQNEQLLSELPQPERIMRLAFWEGATLADDGQPMGPDQSPPLLPLWEVAVPRNYVTRMKVVKGTLEFLFAVRLLLLDKSISFDGVISHLATGSIGFSELSISGIGSLKNPVSFSDLGVLKISGKLGGSSSFAGAIGIREKNTSHEVEVGFPATSEASSTRQLGRRHVLVIHAKIVLASPGGNPKEEYRPFGLVGNYDDVDAGGDGFRDFVGFWQRQSGSTALGTGLSHRWLIEVEVPHRLVLRRWDALRQQVLMAVKTVEAGRDLSFVPALTLSDVADGNGQLIPPWRATYLLLDGLKSDGAGSANVFDLTPLAGPTPGRVAVYARQLTLIPAPAAPALRNGSISFPRLRHTKWQVDPVSDMPPAATVYSHWAKLTRYHFDHEWDLAEEELLKPEDSFWLGFRYDEYLPKAEALLLGPEVRLQGLSLWMPKPATAGSSPITLQEAGTLNNRVRLKVQAEMSVEQRKQLVTYGLRPVGLDLNVQLTALRVGPGGQDDLPGEEYEVGPEAAGTAVRRPPAIIIPLKSAAAEPAQIGRYVLNAREYFSRDSSHDLVLRLHQQRAQPNSMDVLVLDPEPMAVVRVRADDLGGDLAAGTEIANWAYRPGEGSYGWQVRLLGSNLQLLLPPQTLGEAMHRHRDAHDIGPEQPADARFGRPADIRLLASEFGGEFVELPWNLRRRLGYPGQRLPGARLDTLSVELLYGIKSTITHPNLRLTELQARLGASPAYLPASLPWTLVGPEQLQGYSRYRDAWRTIRDALRARPAVWEPYNPALEAPGQLPSGQRLTLRTPHELRVELDSSADLAYPIPGLEPPAILQPLVPHAPDGLRGSFAWAFESANVYHLLWREQVAAEAELTGLQLSSIGGSGQLKAAFAGGNIVITASVTLGRVDSLQVEVRGRISHFWNRARYVVVYERSVAGSRQFMLEQHALRGWPALRKTREYIEVDQPERSMLEPGATTGQRQAASLVQGCLFPTASNQPPRIPVNGRWGQDVGTVGWRVPLWVRGAAPTDVYPKPDVRVLCATDQDGKTTPTPIEDPEKLFFFALTTGTPGPPDSWAAVPGVDFVPLPAEQLAAADPVAMVPGLGAFTFTLGASRPLNLVQGRFADGVVTQLSTVTVMRGPLQKAAVMVAELASARAAADLALSELVPARMNVSADGRDKNGFIADKASVTEAICRGAESLLTSAQNTLNTLGDNPLELVRKQREEIKERLTRAYRDERAGLEQTATFQLLAAVEQACATAQALGQETVGRLSDAQRDELKSVMRIIAGLPQLPGAPAPDADEDASGLRWELTNLRGTPGETQLLIAEVTGAHTEIVEQANDALEAAVEEVLMLWHSALLTKDPLELSSLRQQAADRQAQAAAALQLAADGLLMGAAEVSRRWLGRQPTQLQVLTQDSYNRLRDALLGLRLVQPPTNEAEIPSKREELDKAVRAILAAWSGSGPGAMAFAEDLLRQASTIWQGLQALTTGSFDVLAQGWLSRVNDVIDHNEEAAKLPGELAGSIHSYVDGLLTGKIKDLTNSLDALLNQAENEAHVIVAALLPDAAKLQAYYTKARDQLVLMADQLAEAPERVLLDYLDGVTGGVRAAAADLLAYTEAALVRQLPELGLPIDALAPTALTLLRAFGQPPKVPGLDFQGANLLRGVAYNFLDTKDLNAIKAATNVGLTQLRLLAGDASRQLTAQASELLTPLNLNFDTRELAERFVPDLSKLSLGSLLPNLAGLPLKDLLGNIPIPDGAKDTIKVRQQYDQQTRTRRVYADLFLRLRDAVPLLNLAGITLRLLPGTTLKATISVEAAESHPTQTRTRSQGEISGNWELAVGGMALAQLVNTTLRFDENGRLHFDISPDRIRLQQILDFITRAMPSLGLADSGLNLKVTPTGATAALSLPLPNVQAGTFGLANLYLSFLFGLELKEQFTLLAGIGFGRRSAPFTLTVFVLGGAGWVELDVKYVVPTRKLTATVSIALFASAGIGISLGPISGGVYAYFGVTAEFRTGQSLTLGVMLLFTGSVSLLGLVRVSLSLMLQAEYRSGQLVGRGRVEYKIKIGWLLTIKVKANVAYSFGKSAGNAQRQMALRVADPAALGADDPYELLAEQYLNMFDFPA